MKILLLWYMVQLKAFGFSVNTLFNVTIEVMQKHHVSCLYVLPHSGVQFSINIIVFVILHVLQNDSVLRLYILLSLGGNYMHAVFLK